LLSVADGEAGDAARLPRIVGLASGVIGLPCSLPLISKRLNGVEC
jgi:hypothetical protein